MKRLFFIKIYFIIAITGIMLLATNCRKDKPITDGSAKLSFSTDTIVFDTVFTSIGSTTKLFKVFNPHNQKINISTIKLAGGPSSQYRMNIDGVSCIETHNVEIAAKDSIFIFVKVNIDPLNSNSPLVVSDSILFETNGNQQKVMLVAWGQDAYYYYPDHTIVNPNTGAAVLHYSIIPCNSTWTNDKPHVIYGYAVVDSGCTLNIDAGTRVHLHNNGVLWVYKDGTLKINGTVTDPVTIQGDRLEQDYKDIPGQWGEIWLSAGSKDNEINYAIIKNGTIGIQIDTLGASSNPTLRINNTIIKNMSDVGLYAQGSTVNATNCVIANCGVYAMALMIGGSYDFRHCTIGNYWTYATRQTPALILNNYYKDVNEVYHERDLTKANFGNCIIYGSLDDEISLDKYPTSGIFNYQFQNCLLKTKIDIAGDAVHYISCIKNSDPGFADYTVNNFELSTGSPAIDAGSAAITSAAPAILTDIKGNSRIIGLLPDLGAYEKQP
jgi:hypothetical protein